MSAEQQLEILRLEKELDKAQRRIGVLERLVERLQMEAPNYRDLLRQKEVDKCIQRLVELHNECLRIHGQTNLTEAEEKDQQIRALMHEVNRLRCKLEVGKEKD